MRQEHRSPWGVIPAAICMVILGNATRADDDMQREERAFKSGVEAYVYGYPLVLMNVTRRVMTNVPSPIQMAAPVNQFAHVPSFPDPAFKNVVSPNADTLYSVAWLDVSKEPIVLHVPNTNGRYYLMPMLDAWTNVFTSPGKRTTGTGEGDSPSSEPAGGARCRTE